MDLDDNHKGYRESMLKKQKLLRSYLLLEKNK